MIYPATTFKGQKITICNRYLELFRQEHNSHIDGVLSRSLRASLNDIMPSEYHKHRLIYLKEKWAEVLGGNSKLGFPGVAQENRIETTSRVEELLHVLKRFYKYQRENHGVTIRRLLKEREAAKIEAQSDTTHNPTIQDFRENGLPSKNPLNVSTNFSYLERLKHLNPNVSRVDQEDIESAYAEMKAASYNDDFWDNKIDKEAVRLTASMPEPPDPPQNLTTYTEVDTGGNRLQNIISSDYDFVNVPRTEEILLYKDMGIDFFAGDFEHLFDVQIDSGTAKGYFSMWALANIVGNRKDISDASGDALMMGFGESPTAVRIASLVAIQGGSEIIDTFFPYNKGQRYYQTPKRVGTTFTNKIYSDSDRTILIDTLSLALSSAVSFRYHYAGMSLKDEIASTNISGNAGNYDFQLPAGIILPRRGLGRGLMRGLGRGL